jgi:AcrR family transcriptional regulator
MNQVNEKKTSEAAERIIEVASDLFYSQGYRATGVNEVIKKADVAKATFYNHFPTKDDLCMSCLVTLREQELDFLDHHIALTEQGDPVSHFLCVIESMKSWAKNTDFRGCGFMNIAAEIPDYTNPLRKQGIRLYDEIRKRVEILTARLIDSDQKRYDHLDPKLIVDSYMLSFGGAVMYLELYHAIWPIDHALATMRHLIGVKE